ncbi:MAG: hypothetical protein ACK5JT_04695 [Hyphomicrobiaceae bacterium]
MTFKAIVSGSVFLLATSGPALSQPAGNEPSLRGMMEQLNSSTSHGSVDGVIQKWRNSQTSRSRAGKSADPVDSSGPSLKEMMQQLRSGATHGSIDAVIQNWQRSQAVLPSAPVPPIPRAKPSKVASSAESAEPVDKSSPNLRQMMQELQAGSTHGSIDDVIRKWQKSQSSAMGTGQHQGTAGNSGPALRDMMQKLNSATSHNTADGMARN